MKYGAKIVIANKILFDAFAPLRHNKRKKQKMATERKGSTLPTTSDDSISTVLEEDEEEEELERTDSNDDGLQSLLDNYLGNSSVSNSIKQFNTLNSEKVCGVNDFEKIIKSSTNKNIDWFFKTIINSNIAICLSIPLMIPRWPVKWSM